MLEPQVDVPDPYTLGAHWGVGWILYQEDGRAWSTATTAPPSARALAADRARTAVSRWRC